MAKLVAVTIVIIACLSAVPIVRHTWEPPANISEHGAAIDHQIDETMIEAGGCFLAGQLVLAGMIWVYAGRGREHRIGILPGGALGMVILAFLIVGTEVVILGAVSSKVWAQVYFAPLRPGALPIEVQCQQFAFYFRYPGPDGVFGPIHADLINDANENFFGLDQQRDPASRDDIVTAEMAVPVNREIQLILHSRDLSHSFYVPALRIQQDFVPGLDLSIHFTANKVGRYEIVCTQLCGLGHYNMKAYLDVMSEPDYNDWLKKEAALQ